MTSLAITYAHGWEDALAAWDDGARGPKRIPHTNRLFCPCDDCAAYWQGWNGAIGDLAAAFFRQHRATTKGGA